MNLDEIKARIAQRFASMDDDQLVDALRRRGARIDDENVPPAEQWVDAKVLLTGFSEGTCDSAEVPWEGHQRFDADDLKRSVWVATWGADAAVPSFDAAESGELALAA